MALTDLWAQMRGLSLPVYAAGYQIPIIDGQSLALGRNGSAAERTSMRYVSRAGAKALAGLMRSDDDPGGLRVSMQLHGPLTLSYSPINATGIEAADATGFIPAVFTFALAVDKWRIALNRTPRRMLMQFNGIGGQDILEFNDDNPAIDGELGTHIRDNHARWLSEVMTQAPGAQPLCYGMVQGEADVGQTQAYYYAAATDSYNDALDDIQAATGIRPPLLLWQTGGYTDTVGDPYGSTLAQLDLARDFGGVFAGPLYPGLLFDNNVHPDLQSQLIWSEIGAYVWVRHEMGQNLSMLPGTPSVVGNQITIPFSGLEAGKSLTFDPVDKYASYGGLTNHGCEVSGTTVTDVALSGNAVMITAAAALSGRTVQIAMQSADVSGFVDGDGKNYGAHRCDIMESAPLASRLAPGQSLKRFIPSCRWAV